MKKAKNQSDTHSGVNKISSEKQEKQKRKGLVAAVSAAVSSAVSKKESARLSREYSKPQKYQRDTYDDKTAHYRVKEKASKSGSFKDPYTGADLEMRIQDAKMKYGSDWSSHSAEPDHIDSINKIHGRAKNKAWVKNEDIKRIANREDNFEVISRKINNTKRAKTSEQFYGDKEYLESKGIYLPDEARERGVESGKKAIKETDRLLRKASAKNAAKEIGTASVKGGFSSAAIVGAAAVGRNIVLVCKQKRTTEEAIKDIAKSGASGFISGAISTALITSVQHALESAKSDFLNKIAAKDVPSKIITSVLVCFDLVIKWLKHEITAEEMITELGARVLQMAAVEGGKAIGKIIGQKIAEKAGEAAGSVAGPVGAIVGGILGSLIGAILIELFYDDLVKAIKKGIYNSKDWIKEKKLLRESRAFKKEYLKNIEKYFPTMGPSLPAPVSY